MSKNKIISNRELEQLKNEIDNCMLPIYFNYLTEVIKSPENTYYYPIFKSLTHQTINHVSQTFYKPITTLNV